jgi:ABC-type antimicrobial peptide transport system permease subunit
MIWDEELKVVVGQLEKNISLLKVLYPVVMAVSVLIGAGLCLLLLLQATREAAIMRVLGTTKTTLQLALITEPLILSIIGVIIGLVISRLLWTASGLVPTVPLLSGAGLYLAGVLVGLVIGAISVTNKKPIELLQVKE